MNTIDNSHEMMELLKSELSLLVFLCQGGIQLQVS